MRFPQVQERKSLDDRTKQRLGDIISQIEAKDPKFVQAIRTVLPILRTEESDNIVVGVKLGLVLSGFIVSHMAEQQKLDSGQVDEITAEFVKRSSEIGKSISGLFREALTKESRKDSYIS